MVWNPETMEITGSVDLGSLRKQGTDAEFWTVTHHEGRVYVPVRYANWTTGVIDKSVILVVIDAATDQVLGTLRDERCHSGGRPVFAPNGDAYVLADGRSWSAQRARSPPSSNRSPSRSRRRADASTRAGSRSRSASRP